MVSSRSTLKATLAAALGAGVLLTGGVAAAATGTLPGAAQDTAREMLGKIGVSVPAGEKADEHADQRGPVEETAPEESAEESTSEEGTESAEETGTEESTDESAESNGKGEEVSTLAKSDELEGADKGAAVSELASDGKSRAGDDHGKAGEEHGKPEEGATDADAAEEKPAKPEQAENGRAPVDTPNDGGTGTANQATTEKADGASTKGTENADDKSSGRSAGGDANRP